MIEPPSLPGPPEITDSAWLALETAAKCSIPHHLRWQAEKAIAAFLSAKPIAESAISSRQLKQMALRAKRMASRLSGQAAALAMASAKAIEDAAPRRRGRPGTPEMDRLLVDLTIVYRAAATQARYADWLSFLQCACDLKQIAYHSTQALETRAKMACRGQTPGVPAKRQREAKARRAARLPNTPLGKYMESRLDYIVHASGRFLEAVEITKKNK